MASLLTMVAAPLIARAFALGVADEPHYEAFIAVTSQWLILFGPQILFYGISVYAVAVLNAHGRLALAGFAPRRVVQRLTPAQAAAGRLPAARRRATS